MNSLESKRAVVLFDIDGTLLQGPASGPSAGLKAMERAASTVCGREVRALSVDFAGRTDLQIARAMAAAGGEGEIDNPQLERMIELYLEFLEQEIPDRPYRTLGDPRAAVTALGYRKDLIGLGTGNVRAGAVLKLRSAGIDALFDSAAGGYGDDGYFRFEVLRAGARRIDPTGERKIVVVGDTPFDVEAALHIGAKCIGVPHGNHTARSLLAAGAHAVVEQVDERLADLVSQVLA